MAVQQVRNIAPFIDIEFTVTSEWWVERWGTIHKGLDIATGGNEPVYSMLDGYVIDKGGSTDSTTGYYIIIADKNTSSGYFGFATRYLHLKEPSRLNIGDHVEVGQQVGIEGATGTGVTGIHLHLEMQNVYIHTPQWTWVASDNKSDYIDPTLFMGIDNEEGTEWYYDGTPKPYPSRRESKFKWVLYSNKFRRIR